MIRIPTQAIGLDEEGLIVMCNDKPIRMRTDNSDSLRHKSICETTTGDLIASVWQDSIMYGEYAIGPELASALSYMCDVTVEERPGRTIPSEYDIIVPGRFIPPWRMQVFSNFMKNDRIQLEYYDKHVEIRTGSIVVLVYFTGEVSPASFCPNSYLDEYADEPFESDADLISELLREFNIAYTCIVRGNIAYTCKPNGELNVSDGERAMRRLSPPKRLARKTCKYAHETGDLIVSPATMHKCTYEEYSLDQAEITAIDYVLQNLGCGRCITGDENAYTCKWNGSEYELILPK